MKKKSLNKAMQPIPVAVMPRADARGMTTTSVPSLDVCKKMKRVALLFVMLAFAGCGLYDSGVVWRGGPYVLGWIDLPDEVTLSYDLGGGSMSGRIQERVFAVGWDGRYLVAKQHPKGDKSVTHFYILDSLKDGRYANAGDVVIGPLTKEQFDQRKSAMTLPEFSKVLASLE